MSIPLLTSQVPTLPQTDVEKLRELSSDTPEQREEKLRQVAKEFESLLYFQMLKTMRKTIPESAFADDAPLTSGMGKDAFNQLFDQEISRRMSAGGSGSLSETLYRQLERMVSQANDNGPEKNHEFMPLAPDTDAVPLDNRTFRPLQPSQRAVPIKLKKAEEVDAISRVSSLPASDPIVTSYGRHIQAAARATGVEEHLIYAVIKAESAGDARAVSPAGAQGLMQLMNDTAKAYGVTDRFDPRQNIMAGTRYLKDLKDRFGDVKLALAAYNAGPGNVRRYGGIPPYPETKRYVDRVIDTVSTMSNAMSSASAKVR